MKTRILAYIMQCAKLEIYVGKENYGKPEIACWPILKIIRNMSTEGSILNF